MSSENDSNLESQISDLRLQTEKRKAELEILAKEFDLIDKMYSAELNEARIAGDQKEVRNILGYITNAKNRLADQYGVSLP